MGKTFRMEGIERFNQAVDILIEGVSADNVEPITYGAADIITQEVQRNVDAINRVTGLLAGSPVTRQLERRHSAPAPSIAAIDRKTAPHAHLLEYGTVKMPAQPFYRPAVDRKKSEAIDYIASEISKIFTKG